MCALVRSEDSGAHGSSGRRRSLGKAHSFGEKTERQAHAHGSSSTMGGLSSPPCHSQGLARGV